MRYSLLSIIIFLLVSHSGNGQLLTNKQRKSVSGLLDNLSTQHQPETWLFTGANVLTMTGGPEFQQLDILVEDGRITRIESSIDPGSASVIDAKGKYIMPGLTDMHIHLFSNHQMKETWFLLLLLHGITTGRDMAGEPGKIDLREDIRANRILAPTLYQAGPIIDGSNKQYGVVTAMNEPEGHQRVVGQIGEGYDFIKVYNDLSPEAFGAIIDASGNTPVIGHVPFQIPVQETLGKMQSIEHLTGYVKWEGSKAQSTVSDDVYILTATSGTFNCPTLHQLIMNWDRSVGEQPLHDPAISSLLPGKLKDRWAKMLNENVQAKTELVNAYGDANIKIFTTVTTKLWEQNAPLIAGTDAGNLPFLVPGYSLHQELAALKSLGIPSYEVLKMTTSNAARAMNKPGEFGSITSGARADLIMFDQNPLEHMEALRSPQGVMVRGIWLSRETLDEIESGLAQIFE